MQLAPKLSLTDAAVQAIEAEIANGRWTAGDRLPNEATLAGMLGISRGTVREAVRVLAARGLLETRQGSGTYVNSPNCPADSIRQIRRSSLRDLAEVRRALEVESARLATLRHTPATVAELEELLRQRGRYVETRHEDYVARDLAFHRAITTASGNAALVELYDVFTHSIRRIIDATLSGELPEPDYEAHAAIIAAIATGDPDIAEACVREFWTPIFHALEDMLSP